MQHLGIQEILALLANAGWTDTRIRNTTKIHRSTLMRLRKGYEKPQDRTIGKLTKLLTQTP